MSKADRFIRVIIAVAISAMYINGLITGTLGVALMIVSIVFMLTAFLNFCPLYALLGIRQWERKQSNK
jgi:hypothetical protein